MLYLQIANYDEFREIFGTRVSSRGCIKNKILLSYWKYRYKIDEERGACSMIKSMTDLYDLVIRDLSASHRVPMSEPFRIRGFNLEYSILSARYKTPSQGCIDITHPANICYLDTVHVGVDGKPKLGSMGAGKFFRKLIEEHQPRIPESVITYASEEFQREWQADVASKISQYKLIVDKHFDYIYSSEKCVSTFKSCMCDKEHYHFYEKCVDASAAYLVLGDKIYARCIIFHNVKIEGVGVVNYAERQYAQDKSILLMTLLINKLIAGKYIEAYKTIGADCHAATNIIDIKTGKLIPDCKASISCNIEPKDIVSFMDTFRYYYPDLKVAANTNKLFQGPYHELDHTDEHLRPIIR